MKHCLECGIGIIGRTDKKFCSDNCRNHYNNALHKQRNATLTIINKKLKKNATILGRLAGYGVYHIKTKVLLDEGFDFEFFTHQLTAPDGKKYKYCYNYGYHMVNTEDIILICARDPDT